MMYLKVLIVTPRKILPF